MEAGHATPVPPHGDDEVQWLRAQHVRDLAALDQAADVIAAKDAQIEHLRVHQAGLILDARRGHS